MKLPESFYNRPNVVRIARDLIGKVLYTNIDGILTGGMIVETEAYSWKEKGCHAYGNRRTTRNDIMFAEGGHAYVYLCYGMHYLFNVVTNKKETADAVLIRALEPLEGEGYMRERRGTLAKHVHLTSGPGKLTKALGIDRKLNGKHLLDDEVWIEDAGNRIPVKNIEATPRIGIDYAEEDANLPWRFVLKGSVWVSRKS
jgi:DNA-3-methyladenine glycosylase